MIFVALNEAAQRGELILVQDGMLRYHRRRDGVVVVREILVLPFRRRTGLGRSLVRLLLERTGSAVLRARCPAAYEANHFWRAMGFTLVEEKGGVNLWQRPSQG